VRKLLIHYAFAGGGAKGLAHVAFAKAISKVKTSNPGIDVEDASFVGTSAGAIVASLLHVGYTADELFNASTGKSALTELLGLDDFREVIGPDGPRDIDRLEWLRGWDSQRGKLLLAVALGSLSAYGLMHTIIAQLPAGIASFAILAALIFCVDRARRMARRLVDGFWDTDHFERHLNKLLALKL
jgi:Patatin-like phospholipase